MTEANTTGTGATPATSPTPPATPLHVAIIGTGPRGLTVCERLVALAPSYGQPVVIHVIDPYEPGPGRVWDTHQPAELLMNTTIAEQTVFPDNSCTVSPTNTGPSMEDWYLAAGGTADPHSTFATRRIYGEYLADSFAHIRSNAPDNVTIRVHRALALHIAEPSPHLDEPQLVRLSDGTSIEAHAVVLCVGHIPARLTDERARFAAYAQATGVNYCPPSLPAETPVDDVPAGETVIFRGFGLNYFDLQALFTTGRGGRFSVAEVVAPQPWLLTYQPSGSEPVLAPSSRRGVPYRCKPITAGHPMGSYPLKFFTAANVNALSEGRPLHFDDQLWPLILADIRFAWYAALRRSHPERFLTDPAVLTEALTEAVDRHITRRTWAETQSSRTTGRETREAPAWQDVLDSVVAPAHQLDLQALLRPLEDTRFANRAELTSWMHQFLEDELADAYAGPELAPSKSVFSVLWASRAFVKDLVATGRIHPVSFATEIRGWFESFVSGICDGPPPQRFAELLALSKAGLVEFVGPQVRIHPQAGGGHAAFMAESPVVAGVIRSRHLIDAASPANQVRLADDTLVSSMLDRGQLTVANVTTDDSVLIPSSGLLVDRATFRSVDARGRIHPHRYVMSLQLSAIQLGLAIAANPHTNAQTLCDAHTVASLIYEL